MQIGLLFEQQADLMSAPTAQESTHYHWREPEEVEAVATHLEKLGHTVELIGTLDQLLDRWRSSKLPDLVWNLSVRAQSRSRTALAPALLEQLGIPYTGGDAAVKSLTLNKDWLKPVLQWCGINTPNWQWYGEGEKIETLPSWAVSMLKPTCEGYSLGLVQFETKQGLAALQTQVAQLQQQFRCAVLAEEKICGREITVGVVGNTRPTLVGAVETVTLDGLPIGNRVLDLAAKRQGGFSKQAVDLATPDLASIRDATLHLMRFVQPLDYATFDFRIAANGNPYLIDINADATLHPHRSLAHIAAAAGFSYSQLIQAILDTVLERWRLHPSQRDQ